MAANSDPGIIVAGAIGIKVAVLVMVAEAVVVVSNNSVVVRMALLLVAKVARELAAPP